MEATIDGVRIFYQSVGPETKQPLIVLHGGPGMDHTYFRPWLDVLSDTFRLIYVDQRGQGRSERVDPSTLSPEVFAEDVSKLANTLGLEGYAVLGHSYGSFVALTHAVNNGGGSHYVISHGTASMSKSMPEVEANLASFEPIELREQVTWSWAQEPHIRTQEEAARLMEAQMPFHFASVASEGYRRFVAHGDETVYSPEVLAYISAHGYTLELEDRLAMVDKPVLVITGEHDRTCTPRAAREMQAGLPNSELKIIEGAGHMSFIEEPEVYFSVVRDFFRRHPNPTSG
jgi:proline-specific peptidase